MSQESRWCSGSLVLWRLVLLGIAWEVKLWTGIQMEYRTSSLQLLGLCGSLEQAHLLLWYLQGQINTHPRCPGQDNMTARSDHTGSEHQILAMESGFKMKVTAFRAFWVFFPPSLWGKNPWMCQGKQRTGYNKVTAAITVHLSYSHLQNLEATAQQASSLPPWRAEPQPAAWAVPEGNAVIIQLEGSDQENKCPVSLCPTAQMHIRLKPTQWWKTHP